MDISCPNYRSKGIIQDLLIENPFRCNTERYSVRLQKCYALKVGFADVSSSK